MMTYNAIIITITKTRGLITKNKEHILINHLFACSTFAFHIIILNNGVSLIGTEATCWVFLSCSTRTVKTGQHKTELYEKLTGHRNVVGVRGFVLYPVHNT